MKWQINFGRLVMDSWEHLNVNLIFDGLSKKKKEKEDKCLAYEFPLSNRHHIGSKYDYLIID